MRPSLTVDIGTTNLKIGLYGSDGEPVATLAVPTPVIRSRDGQEQDMPAVWSHLRTFIADLGEAQRAQIGALAFAGVGESGGLVDDELRLLSPVIVWHDQRGAAFVDGLSEPDREAIYRTCGLPPSPNYGLPKLAWLLSRDPGLAQRDCRWLNVSEILAAQFTGVRQSEYTLASRTMALDLRRREWSTSLLDLFGIPSSMLPPVAPATAGRPILPRMAHEFGLTEGVEVFVAGHDHMVGAVGAELAPGELLNSTGTTEGLLTLPETFRLTPPWPQRQFANGIACDGVRPTFFGSLPTGGNAFAWLTRFLGRSADDVSAICAHLASTYDSWRPTASLPVVIPHLAGSPPPGKSRSARGWITGISTETDLDALVLATFLGLAAEMRFVTEAMGTVGNPVRLIGPAARNPLWTRLKADLLGTTVHACAGSQMVSRGAQSIAGGGAVTPMEWTTHQPSDRHVGWQDWYEEAFRPLRARKLDLERELGPRG